jgi:H+-translocating NAD(P) transhydrogenase
VAFMKLAGHMSSRPLILPQRHLINGSLLGANMLSMAGFLSMAPATPALAAGFLGANTILSFIKGYSLTAAVGGADMRE